MLHIFLTALVWVSYVINAVFGVIVVFYERRNPAVTWAWLMVIVLAPYIGFVIYLVFGLGGRRHRVFEEKARCDEKLYADYTGLDANRNSRAREQLSRLFGPERAGGRLGEIAYLNYYSGNGPLSWNNDVTIYHDGNAKFEAFLKDIANARRFVHLQYYIVRDDALGRRVIEALTRKAAEGVEVRFLVDGTGCLWTSKKLFRPLTDAGGHWAEFLPTGFLLRLNFRNHRKICVIDGNIGYIGGLNIGDEYLGLSPRFGPWLDKHLRVTGDAVGTLELRFMMDWNYSSRDRLAAEERCFPKAPLMPAGERRTGVQMVSSGPDTPRHNILYAYVKMIAKAEKSVYIQSPYFVPDDSVLEALRIAALSGIDVRIMIPANPDHPFVYPAALSYLGELIRNGVKCYQYENGFVHSKMVLIDGAAASVGTANMDVRSFKLNFEINAFIYDAAVAGELEARFLKDIDDCTVIDEKWYASRGRWAKAKESVSRLLSPLL
ncbi:MAG: cardiolipin synthase [Firmicutes bacterium]|nr:cardiolipin synthase [Bacillota bacterium]